MLPMKASHGMVIPAQNVLIAEIRPSMQAVSSDWAPSCSIRQTGSHETLGNDACVYRGS